MNIIVRIATHDDLDAMFLLWRELEEAQGPFRLFPLRDDIEERVRAQLVEAIEAPDARAFVAEDEDGVAGMAIAWFEDRKGSLDEMPVVDLSRVVVRAGRRGAGIGSALVAAAEGFAQERGARYMQMASFTGNDAAREFWARRGFFPRYEARVRAVGARVHRT